jgi:Etoposide-induced protein 2.4 (EI24)
MKDILDSWWRACVHAFHPRVIIASLLPLAVSGSAVALLGWFYWEDAVALVRDVLAQWALLDAVFHWLSMMGASGLRAMAAPLFVVAVALPIIVIVSLLLVAWLMTPVMVGVVARQRFPHLVRSPEFGSAWKSVLWSLACSVLALLALIVTLPLWLFPPLAVIVPAVIWGWLTAKVFAFDALAGHATASERRLILYRDRWLLLGMGMVCGLMGSAPALVWSVSALTLVFAPVLVLVCVWIYTLVFAVSGLWFAHFCLARLEQLRGRRRSSSGVVADATVLASGPRPIPPPESFDKAPS